MSSFTTSTNLLFVLPRFLFPGNSLLSILVPTCLSSFIRTCPHHLRLASRVFSPNRHTCAVPLLNSFMILPILVTPNANRNVFNCAIFACNATCQSFVRSQCGERYRKTKTKTISQPSHDPNYCVFEKKVCNKLTGHISNVTTSPYYCY